jgi:hypothetical protein
MRDEAAEPLEPCGKQGPFPHVLYSLLEPERGGRARGLLMT